MRKFLFKTSSNMYRGLKKKSDRINVCYDSPWENRGVASQTNKRLICFHIEDNIAPRS